MAGAAAARMLADLGRSVLLLDKARGVGGRMSTRRSEVGPFDHGAQFLRAHDAAFRRQIDSWVESGVAAAWSPRFATHPAGDFVAWIGTPGMQAPVRALVAGLPLRVESPVLQLKRVSEGWQLLGSDGLLVQARKVVLSAPAPQSLTLLAPHSPQLADALADARYAPCWAAMVQLDSEAEVDAVRDAADIAWAAADASRPGRPAGRRWVVHGSADFSRQFLEDKPGDVGRRLADALALVLDRDVELHTAHRWRHAQVERAIGQACLVDEGAGLAVAGDACLGGRIEAAWLSGRAAAEALLGLRG